MTRQLETLRGPKGITIELDRGEVYPDDPGAGTPAMVFITGVDACASYWCAVNEGCLEGTVRSYKLTKAQLQWLQSMESEVEDFLYN